MDRDIAPGFVGQGFCAEITGHCNSSAQDYSVEESLSASVEAIDLPQFPILFRPSKQAENASFSAISHQRTFCFNKNRQAIDLIGDSVGGGEGFAGGSLFIYTGNVENPPSERGKTRPREDSPWHEQSSWRGMAVSRYVDNAEAKHMMEAGDHMQRLQRPLNVMVTVRPYGIDAMPVEDRSGFWTLERNAINSWSRRQDRRRVGYSGMSMLWCREAELDGSLEHMHLAGHVRDDLVPAFCDMLLRRYGTPECPVTLAACRKHCPDALEASAFGSASWSIDLDASTRPRPVGTKLGNAVTYLVKNIRPQPKRSRLETIPYRPGGHVLGKRVGWSSDLAPAAIDRWDRNNRLTPR